MTKTLFFGEVLLSKYFSKSFISRNENNCANVCVLVSAKRISMWIGHGKYFSSVLIQIPRILYYVLNIFYFQKQSEILFFLLFVIVVRSRKTGSVSMLAYLSTGFMYCKVASLMLWFNADPRYGLVFLVLFVCKLNLIH